MAEDFNLPEGPDGLSAHAHRIVSAALTRHGGPSDRALQDVLWAWAGASQAGRDHLFLVVAGRAVGAPYEPEPIKRPSPTPTSRPDPGPSGQGSDLPVAHRELAEFVRAYLALIQNLQVQTAEERPDAPR